MNHATRMNDIGRQLELAVAADLRAEAAQRSRGWRAKLASRRARILTGLTVAVAIAAPGAAWAAGLFTTSQQEAASLPATFAVFAGTDPTCTVVVQGAEYHCTLVRPPRALPYIPLTGGREGQLFGMSKAQTREFSKVSTGSNLQAYNAFVASVRRYRATLDQRLLAQWGVPPALVAQWVTAMKDLDTDTALREGHFKGHIMQTTDTSYRVDGGCIATNATGSVWQCYLGQAAVHAHVVAPAALGGQMFGGPTDAL
jgi:hypothetical protein